MISRIRHFVRRKVSERRERKKESTRSPRWRAVRARYLREHPFCAGCGSQRHLQLHHVRPYHLHPELELEPSNLVTACMDTSECHLLVCHGDSFRAYNPNVVNDLEELRREPSRRRAIVSRAKLNSLLTDTKEKS